MSRVRFARPAALPPLFGGRLSALAMGAFALLVLFELLALYFGINVHVDEPGTVLLALAVFSPLVGLAVLLSPSGVLLAVPLFIVVPWRSFGVEVYEMLFLAALFAAVVRAGASGSGIEPVRWMEAVFALYVVWTAVTLFAAADVHLGLGGLKRIIMTFLAFVVGVRVLGARHSKGLLRIMAVLATIIGLQLVIVILVKGFSIQLLATRVLSFTDLGWGRSNYIAAIATLCACGAIALTLFGGTFERVLGIVAILAALFVQAVTISRGGAVALLAGLLLAASFEGRRRLIPALGLVVVMVGGILVSPLGQAMIARFVGPTRFASIGIRFLFYREAFLIARTHPFLGVGPDQLSHHTLLQMEANPHNFLLKIAADHGLIGLGLMVTLLILAVRHVSPMRAAAVTREDRMRALALILFIGVGVVNSSYEPALSGSVYGFLFWLSVGALTAPGRVSPRPAEDEAIR